jgi:formamidopyrimidine-DNA glycosylase
MPELPEVETTRLGLLPQVEGRRVVAMTIRNRHLRWPIPKGLERKVVGSAVSAISRRGKYLLWHLEQGLLLTHLGMSGSLRVIGSAIAPTRHDHVDLAFDNGKLIRYTDPRRFGAMLWIDGNQPKHPLLSSLGPEPLSDAFDGDYLYATSRGRTVSVKEFIMNSHVVVGVGNIYASESLFLAGIRPTRAAGKLSAQKCRSLADAIKATLEAAISAGGSSLRDYVQASGELGYFQVNAYCYDREGHACRRCKSLIMSIRQGQRSTYFCPHCQK